MSTKIFIELSNLKIIVRRQETHLTIKLPMLSSVVIVLEGFIILENLEVFFVEGSP